MEGQEDGAHVLEGRQSDTHAPFSLIKHHDAPCLRGSRQGREGRQQRYIQNTNKTYLLLRV